MTAISLWDLAGGELERRGLRVVRYDPDLNGRPWRPTLYVVPIVYQEDLSNITPPLLPPTLSTSTRNTKQQELITMRKKDVFPSKYLKQEDVPASITVTIKHVEIETVGVGDDAADKPVLEFQEPHVKPMVINASNWNVLETAFGDSDDWGGKRVTVYRDPNIMFGSKTVGGLRVRIPTAKKQPATPPAPPVQEELPDIENDYGEEVEAEA